MLGHMPADLDLAVDGDGLIVARQLADSAGGSFVPLDAIHHTGRVVLSAERTATTRDPAEHTNANHAPVPTIDIAALRASTLEEDLRLRDFTINAMALPLTSHMIERIATLSEQQRSGGLPALLESIIDPCGGCHDLALRRLRLCLPSSLRDDPVRLMRAVRLAAEYGLAVSSALDQAIRRDVVWIDYVAIERVRDELLKLLALTDAASWLWYLDDVRLLTRLIPELEPARTCDQPIVHFLPVLGHILEAVVCVEWILNHLAQPAPRSTQGNARAMSQSVVTPSVLPVAVQTYPDLPLTLRSAVQLHDHMRLTIRSNHTRAALLKLAVLLHDVAKPQTKQPKPGGGVTFYGHQQIGAQDARIIAQRLKLSRNEIAYISRVVREHMRPGQLRNDEHVTPRAIARFFRDTDGHGPDVLIHALADHLAARGPNLDLADWQRHLDWTDHMLQHYWGEASVPNQPLLNGHTLIQVLQLEPGPLVGLILREVQEAQSAGEIHNTEEALHLASQVLTQLKANS
ncbi:MAG: HD domain-containing protein [Chloroflexaceae bacterium]|nr:HD domain-containing protein [Chloroflexaceae bacterium]